MYTPKPIDTSSIVLPKEIEEIAQKLAENTHEVWAEGRIKDGWKYGPTRNDERKEHPCLVPYSQLTDEEKSYDINTAIETLKVVMGLGFNITKAED